ncbi:hypothetical protein [Blastococcus mobilis]|uniref:O-antigen ligase n=1 Tax=Blastococcus mobilis TaxID=1938746 RepID=A0A239AP60_9ACTN|nr:hypothetical protein [Blastococcus mobilis]SNR96788.1 hypothetical protein SAMN06272737_1502 [Blastococcus mobilis]
MKQDKASAFRSDDYLAFAATTLIGFRYQLQPGLTTDIVATVLTLPLWISVVAAYKHIRPLIATGVIMVLASLLLSWDTAASQPVSWETASGVVRFAVFTIMSLGPLCWARTRIGVVGIALAYSAGAMLRGLLSSAVDIGLLWKYGLALPVAYLLLAVLVATRARMRTCMTTFCMLALVGVLNDYRSYTGICLLTALLLVVHRRQPLHSRALHKPLRTAALITALAASVYYLFSAAAVGGLLGSDIQAVSKSQAGGDSIALILGGRPEWAATLSLMMNNPTGYGAGAVPTSIDLAWAKEGLSSTTLGIGGNYVNDYMFGGAFKLHSLIADFWVNFGLPGLAWTLALAAFFVMRLTRAPGDPARRAMVSFASIAGIWFLLFGPILSNLPDVIFLVALVAEGAKSQVQAVPTSSTNRGESAQHDLA